MRNISFPQEALTTETVSEIDQWLNKIDPSNLIAESGPNRGNRQKLFACIGIVHRLSKDGKNVEFAIVKYCCPYTGKFQNKFSGGGSEANERPIDVVNREVSEELDIPTEIVSGLDFKPLRDCAVYKKNYGKVANVLIFFVAQNPLNDFELPEFNGSSDKAIKGRGWMTMKKLLESEEYPGLYLGYRDALAEAKTELINTREEYAWLL